MEGSNQAVFRLVQCVKAVSGGKPSAQRGVDSLLSRQGLYFRFALHFDEGATR